MKTKNIILILGMLLLIAINVFGLSFTLEQGVSSTLPLCAENEFLLFSSGNWTCADYVAPTGSFNLTCNNGEITIYNTTSNTWECGEYPTLTGGDFNLTCDNGQTTIYNTTTNAWECYTLPSVVTIYDIVCSDGEILEYDTINGWECGTDSTGTDTNAGTICSAGEYLDGDGSCYLIPVDTDTNAGTICDDGEYLNGNGSCYSVSETMMSFLESLTIYPTSFNVVRGTLTNGNLTSLLYYNHDTLNISAVAVAPALDLRINFTNVTSFNSLVYRISIDDPDHEIGLQLWDYDENIWEDYASFIGTLGFEIGSVPVLDYPSHVLNGVVQVRFTQPNGGNPNHKFYFDLINLVDGYGITSANNHDALTGRNDILNNHPNIHDIFYNKSEVYNISEIDGFFLNHYLKTDVYNKSEVDALIPSLTNYYTKIQVYNISEIDTKINSIEGTYLYNKSCGNNEYLRFNTTANDWDCVIISLTGGDYPENITVNTITFDYGKLNSTFESLLYPNVSEDVILWSSLSDASSEVALLDQSTYSTDLVTYSAGYDEGQDAFNVENSQHILGTGTQYNLNSNYTINVWVYIDTLKNYNGIWDFSNTGTNGGSYLLVGSDGKITLVNPGQTNIATATGVISAGSFKMITIVRGGTTNYIYVDGVHKVNGTSNIASATGSHIAFGNELENLATRGLDGQISHVSIYDRALTFSEIGGLYTLGRTDLITESSFADPYYAYTNISYFSDKVSATGYITRTPTDKEYLKDFKKIDDLNLTLNYRDDEGKLNQDLLFENEKVNKNFGSYYVDAVADNNRVMILELIDERNNLINQIDLLKTEMCIYDKKYSWCEQ